MMFLLKLLTIVAPWFVKRWLLTNLFGYNIHKDARIGLSWVYPKKLWMAENSKIAHFTIAINLDHIRMDVNSSIGRGNWITGFPTKTNSVHFQHQLERKAELLIGECSSITKNHHFDCTNSISIGRFSTIAGYNSQFLTHSIDLIHNRQDSYPILIGDYAFVGTNVVVLGGATLPSRSVLGAKSLLNKNFDEEWTLYGGVPAKILNTLPRSAAYFFRSDGFVY